MVKCKYKHLFMTPKTDNVAANVCRSQGWSDGRKKKHSSSNTRDTCNMSVPLIFLFPLSSWFYVLPENVAFWAMKRETFLWESCCLKLPSENTFRSTPKEPATELCSCSWPQFLWDTMLNCSPPLKVAKREEVWEERKILLFPFGSSNLLCQSNCLWDGNLLSYHSEIAMFGKSILAFTVHLLFEVLPWFVSVLNFCKVSQL